MDIKDRISRNFGIKLSAALLSIILWAYIWGERKANNEIAGELIQREFTGIPLAVLKDSISVYETTISHNEVGIVMEGESDIIGKIDKDDIIAYVDIRELGAGGYQLPPAWKIPLGVKIVASSPEFITVTIVDKRITEVKPLVESITPKKEPKSLEVIK